MWPSFYAPTWAGLRLAMGHTLGLLLASLLIQTILRCYTQNEVVYAFYQLLRPWQILGFPSQMVAVRLGLMFEELQWLSQQNHGVKALFAALDVANQTQEGRPTSIELPKASWSIGDSVSVMIGLISLVAPYGDCFSGVW
jgi:hypothetical protein